MGAWFFPQKKILIAIGGVLLLGLGFVGYRELHHNYYEAVTVTGATPLALHSQVPGDFHIDVKGLVKRDYAFGSGALRAFATTRIRTKEISPACQFEGIYVYLAIPVYNLLEGVAPACEADSDNPLDFLVTFESVNGKDVHFPWAELMMAGDDLPVALAYSRVPVVGSSERQKEGYSPPAEMLSGFRLIAPRDFDTARYLDDVIRVRLRQVRIPAALIPKRQKGLKCVAKHLTCMAGERVWRAQIHGLRRESVESWVRVGHGRGFLGQEAIKGYPLRDILLKNFDTFSPEDYFMLVACDGYRVLCAGREILRTEAGGKMLVLDEMNGHPPPGGIMLACPTDYYADRGLWGMTHIVKFSLPWDDTDSIATLKGK